jgi:hypothetical protein
LEPVRKRLLKQRRKRRSDELFGASSSASF